MTTLPENQIAKLRETSKFVMSSYESLDVTDVINRIHIFTGRDLKRSIAGLKLMIEHELIPKSFITSANKLPKIEKLVDVAWPLIGTFDAELVGEKQRTENAKHQVASVGHVSDGPTDDADEDPMQDEPVAATTSTADRFGLSADF